MALSRTRTQNRRVRERGREELRQKMKTGGVGVRGEAGRQKNREGISQPSVKTQKGTVERSSPPCVGDFPFCLGK